MRRVLLLLPLLLAATITSGVLLSLHLTSAQVNTNTTLALDMVPAGPAGNTYCDGAGLLPDGVTPCSPANSMTVGAVDSCFADAAGDNNPHTHIAQVIVQNVQDMIGWQVRLNYDGGKMRPNSVQFMPFTDSNTLQGISFVNLPIDSGTSTHLGLNPASFIPPASPGPQTAAFGSSYLGTQTAPVSPDTPPKSPADDTSYSAPTGGILAAIQYQVLAGQQGQNNLILDVDDADPNSPGSGISYFNGTGSVLVDLSQFSLGDGYHAEGAAACAPPTPMPATATPTATATPAGATRTPTATPRTSGATTGASGSAGAGGAGAAGRTATQAASQLPGTGGEQGDSSAWPYALLVLVIAVPASGAGYAVWRLRRR